MFDILPSNLEKLLRSTGKRNPDWKEDLKFYENQKLIPQVGNLGARDRVLSERLKEMEQRHAEEISRKEKACVSDKNTLQTNMMCDDDDIQIMDHEDKVSENLDYIPSYRQIRSIEKARGPLLHYT